MMRNRSQLLLIFGFAVIIANGAADSVYADLSGQRPEPKVSAGHYHSLMIRSDGTVWQSGWVMQDPSECDGDPSSYHIETDPVQIPGRTLENIIAVAAGQRHSIALDVRGRIHTWGCNAFGQLGTVNRDHSPYPHWVYDANGKDLLEGFVAVAAGARTSYALKADGTVWAWGIPPSDRSGMVGAATT